MSGFRAWGQQEPGRGRWGDAESCSHPVSGSPLHRFTYLCALCVVRPARGGQVLARLRRVGCSSLFLALCLDLRGSVRTGEREMGRQGELFAPRLRVTPSPVHVFMCFMRCSIRQAVSIQATYERWCRNYPLDGSATTAVPGVVFSPFEFSSQISHSARFSSPSTYFLVTVPLQVRASFGTSMPR